MSNYSEGYYKSADGLSLYYRDYSAGISQSTPLLCLPGLTRNSKDFEEFADLIAPRRRVICMDFRGRGHSDNAASIEAYSPQHIFGDVVSLLTVLGLPRAVFIGTSLGGMITQVTALLRPDLVAGAVLNDIGPESSPVGIQRIASYAGVLPPVSNWTDAVQQVKFMSHTQYSKLGEQDWQRMARKLFAVRDGRPVLNYDPQIGASVRVPPMLNEKPIDMWEIFRALANIPTLAIRGELSDLLSAEILGKMKAAKPDLMTVDIPDQGHVPLLETPTAFKAIEELLRRADAR